MSTGIRLPADVGLPDRDSYGDEYEESRSLIQMETGSARRRNKFRIAPRVFDLSWTLTQSVYALFDNWWQNTIRGGERPFDLQLLDDDETLVWYTVRAVGGTFSAQLDQGGQFWTVQLKVRTTQDSFLTRDPGTDELRGTATVGIAGSSGRLQVYTPLRGTANVGVTGTGLMRPNPYLYGRITVGATGQGALLFPPLYGAATVGVQSAPGRLTTAPPGSYPELSRVWDYFSWLECVAGVDVRSVPQAITREWMEV